MPREPSPEIEIIQAHADAMAFAFRTLVRCLEDKGALDPGQLYEALRVDMELRHQDESDMTLAMLHHLRTTLME